jgi:hypothetical protein
MSVKFTTERNDRMYEAMKKDVIRHENLCFELATKFEAHYDTFHQIYENIESLKSHALTTDLHLEAFLPL